MKFNSSNNNFAVRLFIFGFLAIVFGSLIVNQTSAAYTEPLVGAKNASVSVNITYVKNYGESNLKPNLYLGSTKKVFANKFAVVPLVKNERVYIDTYDAHFPTDGLWMARGQDSKGTYIRFVNANLKSNEIGSKQAIRFKIHFYSSNIVKIENGVGTSRFEDSQTDGCGIVNGHPNADDPTNDEYKIYDSRNTSAVFCSITSRDTDKIKIYYKAWDIPTHNDNDNDNDDNNNQTIPCNQTNETNGNESLPIVLYNIAASYSSYPFIIHNGSSGIISISFESNQFPVTASLLIGNATTEQYIASVGPYIINSRNSLPVSFTLPTNIPIGKYDLVLRITSGNKLVDYLLDNKLEVIGETIPCNQTNQTIPTLLITNVVLIPSVIPVLYEGNTSMNFSVSFNSNIYPLNGHIVLHKGNSHIQIKDFEISNPNQFPINFSTPNNLVNGTYMMHMQINAGDQTKIIDLGNIVVEKPSVIPTNQTETETPTKKHKSSKKSGINRIITPEDLMNETEKITPVVYIEENEEAVKLSQEKTTKKTILGMPWDARVAVLLVLANFFLIIIAVLILISRRM